MKKLNLGNVIPLITVSFFVFLTSCGKNTGGAGGGGPVIPNPPPSPSGTKPTVTASNPAKAWYSGTITGTFSVAGSPDNLNVTATASDSGPVPVSVSGNGYTITTVVSYTTIKILAENKYGKDSAIVYGDVWSPDVTGLCKDARIFDPVYLKIGTLPPQTSGLTGSYQFNTDGTGTYFLSGSSNAEWRFTPTGGIYLNGPTWQTFRFIDSRTFEVTGTDGNGGPLVIMRYLAR